MPPGFEMEGVNDLPADNDVGGDVPVLDKSSLSIVNKISKVRF